MLDKLLDNEDILMGMLSMPDKANEQMVQSRRKELFGALWRETGMEKDEVLSMLQDREDQFIDKYHEGEIPEWLMRCEAQDVLLEMITERFKEEELIP